MNKKYKERKIKELLVLNPRGAYQFYGFSNLLYDKRAILVDKVCNFLRNNVDLRPTNLNVAKNYELGDFILKYNYQRFDSSFLVEKFAERFYKITGDYSEFKLFTNSGMSAISSFFLSLNSISKFRVVYDEDIYFETKLFFQEKCLKNLFVKNVFPPKILYIDSIAYKNGLLKKRNWEQYFAIVIDNTCWYSNEFSKEITEIIAKGKICILLRSHTKLDMMGSDVVKLGSIVYLLPKYMKNRDYQIIEAIIKKNFYYLGVIGGFPELYEIPEFLLSAKFHKINNERIIYIRKNNALLYRELLAQKIAVILPEHQLFCLVKCGNELHEADLKRKIQHWVNGFDFDMLPIKFAGSFAFDFIAVDTYNCAIDHCMKIRISFGDLPEEYVNTFVQEFMRFIHDNF